MAPSHSDASGQLLEYVSKASLKEEGMESLLDADEPPEGTGHGLPRRLQATKEAIELVVKVEEAKKNELGEGSRGSVCGSCGDAGTVEPQRQGMETNRAYVNGRPGSSIWIESN